MSRKQRDISPPIYVIPAAMLRMAAGMTFLRADTRLHFTKQVREEIDPDMRDN